MIKAVTELAERLGYKIIYRCIKKEWVAKGEGTYYCSEILGININEKYKNSPFMASLYIAQCICLLKLTPECNISTAQEYAYELLDRFFYLQFGGKRPEAVLTEGINWTILTKCSLKNPLNEPTNTTIMNKEMLEEILDPIRESIGYKVEQIEGLTQSFRIIYEKEEDLKVYGNEIAIQAIISSIDDAANDMLFNGTWDAERHFQYIKFLDNTKAECQDELSKLKIDKDGITKME